MTNCPVCGKAVDPLRAPAVGVLDGKVVSFCSREHALEMQSKPTVMPAPRAKTDPAFRIPDADQKKNKENKENKEREKAKKRTPPAGVAQPASLYDSGPVIEIIHEPASGVVTSAPDARSSLARTGAHAEASGAIQIADTGHLDDYVSADDDDLPRRSRGWIAILVLMVLAGGVFAAYELGYLDKLTKHDSQAATTHPIVHDAGIVEVRDAAWVTATAAIAQATTVLQKELGSSTPRVQHLAASALARTDDSVAIASLAASLAKDDSDLSKLEALYALARSGDKRGSDGLAIALSSPKRDVKLEAAHRLALLGDKRAIDTLAQYLDVSQLRLGVAIELAYLAEPRAIKALEAIRADATSTADEKARAAIALGYAGQRTIAPALHELIKDNHNAFAAGALANLGDEAARPVLVKQLETSSLRVFAARALRQLDPNLDPGPLLPPLLAALSSEKDTDRVQAAEALLVIAGPVAWSKHE